MKKQIIKRIFLTSISVTLLLSAFAFPLTGFAAEEEEQTAIPIEGFSAQVTYVKANFAMVGHFDGIYAIDAPQTTESIEYGNGGELVEDRTVTAFGLPSYYEQISSYDAAWFEDNYLLVTLENGRVWDDAQPKLILPQDVAQMYIRDGKLFVETKFADEYLTVEPDYRETVSGYGRVGQRLLIEVPKSAVPEEYRNLFEDESLAPDYEKRELVRVEEEAMFVDITEIKAPQTADPTVSLVVTALAAAVVLGTSFPSLKKRSRQR